MTTIKTFGDHDERTIEQLKRCAEEGTYGVLCADGHLGYSQPIGGAVAYEDYISPSGVGFDIGCGNKAVATTLLYSEIKDDLPRIMDEITKRISFGMGRPNNEPVDHAIFDRINRDAPLPGIRKLLGTARAQLGTVGGGNHYVDLFREEGSDRVWIGVHFGSRGFGHKVASGFLALAQGKEFDERASEGSMDAPPTLLHIDSPVGHLYIEAMTIAGEYAYAGRDVVVRKVLEILGTGAIREIHNHHNYAWREEHFGKNLWVVRKGCTPAFPGQEGFVGGSMGDISVILVGTDSETNRDALYSTVHGAGRQMSRTEAKGKSRKRALCSECGHAQARGEGAFTICPECFSSAVRRVWVQESEGRIDWKAVKRNLKTRGITVRGGDADEAPGAYKDLTEVLGHHKDAITIEKTLVPVGVAMAGPGIAADD